MVNSGPSAPLEVLVVLVADLLKYQNTELCWGVPTASMAAIPVPFSQHVVDGY